MRLVWRGRFRKRLARRRGVARTCLRVAGRRNLFDDERANGRGADLAGSIASLAGPSPIVLAPAPVLLGPSPILFAPTLLGPELILPSLWVPRLLTVLPEVLRAPNLVALRVLARCLVALLTGVACLFWRGGWGGVLSPRKIPYQRFTGGIDDRSCHLGDRAHGCLHRHDRCDRKARDEPFDQLANDVPLKFRNPRPAASFIKSGLFVKVDIGFLAPAHLVKVLT